jgi:saccharopine dehydrogenase (NADP+, L-glutamate forming)
MFLMYRPNDTVEKKVADALGIDEQDPIMDNLTWLGLFESQKIPIKQGSPADVMQLLLEQKLTFSPDDKDMVVMQHQFEYEQEGKKRSLVSSMVLKGDKGGETAMAKTVGWPLALAALMIADRTITKKGVFIPTEPSLYTPMLATLKTLGVSFHEEEYEL